MFYDAYISINLECGHVMVEYVEEPSTMLQGLSNTQ